MVIGGGNSATEESLYLAKITQQVILLVRGNKLKASQILIEKVFSQPNIILRYNSEVTEFKGAGGKLNTVSVSNKHTGVIEDLHPAGVLFLSVKPRILVSLKTQEFRPIHGALSSQGMIWFTIAHHHPVSNLEIHSIWKPVFQGFFCWRCSYGQHQTGSRGSRGGSHRRSAYSRLSKNSLTTEKKSGLPGRQFSALFL